MTSEFGELVLIARRASQKWEWSEALEAQGRAWELLRPLIATGGHDVQPLQVAYAELIDELAEAVQEVVASGSAYPVEPEQKAELCWQLSCALRGRRQLPPPPPDWLEGAERLIVEEGFQCWRERADQGGEPHRRARELLVRFTQLVVPAPGWVEQAQIELSTDPASRTIVARQAALAAQLSILRTETDLLSHELSLALNGGALTQGQVLSGLEAGPDTREHWKPHSRSQLEQDLWVLEALNWKRGGYFVEFGATDGVLLSNTWLLEKHFGWQGICCEPNPNLFKALQANRACLTCNDCIYRSSGEVMDFVLANAYGGLAAHSQADSHVEKRQAYEAAGETLTVTTLSLMDLLERCAAPREIDYLSIDTEGSELAILEGVNWDRYRFQCLTIEHNFTAEREAIAGLLAKQGYRRIEAKWDDWYVLEGH